MSEKQGFTKGIFGKAGLPAAQAYLNPESRNHLLALGAGAASVLGVGLAVGIWFTGGGLLSSGPLSSSHSGLEGDCRTCHDAFQSVSDRKCLNCHEGGAGAVAPTSAARLAYRSDDLKSGAAAKSRQVTCSACHPEHRGRGARPVSPSNENCAFCHPFEPFESAHPGFAFQVGANEDSANPAFSHDPHLQALRADAGDGRTPDLCTVCHRPLSGGRSFAPVDFAVHCADCHHGDHGGLKRRYDGTERPDSRRAAFDHRAHAIQRTCLDCHSRIRPRELSPEAPESRAAARNLPGIEVCRECHNARLASDSCTLCHRFHPHPTGQSPTPAR